MSRARRVGVFAEWSGRLAPEALPSFLQARSATTDSGFQLTPLRVHNSPSRAHHQPMASMGPDRMAGWWMECVRACVRVTSRFEQVIAASLECAQQEDGSAYSLSSMQVTSLAAQTRRPKRQCCGQLFRRPSGLYVHCRIMLVP